MSEPSDVESSDSDSSQSGPREPRYAPQEYTGIFLDFYTFLTTLHYNAEYLKIPPPEGWTFTSEFYSELGTNLGKSDLVLEVLRYLPYFDNKCQQHVHYKCSLIDFTTYPPDHLEDVLYRDEEFLWDLEEDDANIAEVICFATGGESGGRRLFLNVRDGSIIEDRVAYGTREPVEVKKFFDNLKEAYRNLKLIPCPGRTPEEGDQIEEADPGTQITQAQVLNQERNWGTKLDIQYIRQLYRQYGWPDNFQKDIVTTVINELMKLAQQKGRYEWEKNTLGPWWYRDLINLK